MPPKSESLVIGIPQLSHFFKSMGNTFAVAGWNSGKKRIYVLFAVSLALRAKSGIFA
jgi:hypothetical protein